MKLIINTSLKDIRKNEVKKGFTQDLFLSLNPPFPPVELLRFDGCSTGDIVSLKLNFVFFSQVWKSEIIEDRENEDSWYFIDKGIKLPFFLKSWKHKHIVNNTADGSEIIDDIEFSTGTLLTDFLMYPVLFGQFIYRKPVYRSFFKKMFLTQVQ